MLNGEDPTGLFRRFDGNPILTATDWPYPANTVFNAAATRFHGKTLLLVRVEDFRGISHLTVATSKDGFTDWRVDEQPNLHANSGVPVESWGLEDPRIVHLAEERKYAICYTGYSRGGPVVCLATTGDFKSYKRCGAILPPSNKDASIFPRRIDGQYVLLHRPAFSGQSAHIWIARSPDLQHWGQHALLLQARQGFWDSQKIGLGPQPIETPEGWLILYHGVRLTAAGSIYRLGLALLDLDDPTQVIRRSQQWVFGPTTDFERTGDVGNANFPCGLVVDEQKDELYLYYGAADTCMAVATAKVSELLEFLKRDSQ